MSETCSSDFIRQFSELAREIKEKFGARVWLVEVLGKRRAYVAGELDDGLLPCRFIHLNEKYALVSGEWEKVPGETIERTITALQGMLDP